MAEHASGDHGGSSTLDERVDAACDRFEAAWRAGERPSIADYLLDAPASIRSSLLRELLAVDLGYRRLAGETPTLGDYRGVVTEGGEALADLFAPAHEGGSTVIRKGSGPAVTVTAGDAAGVGPRFEIIAFHARGGLGTISRALDLELGREVALKQIREASAGSEESRRRFDREARVTGRLQHPGIIPVYASGRDERGRPYYAMRFIEGRTLREAVLDERAGAGATGGRLRLRELIGRFQGACNAIAYAHSRGVIHRDLKPENILLGPFGETIVVDWGLARQVDAADAPASPGAIPPDLDPLEVTQEDNVVGTPAYMSPEQASGLSGRIDTRSDIYGLGATLFFVLAGRPPIGPGPAAEVLDRARRGELDLPRSPGRGVPRALDAIARRALAFRPEDRYASVTEMVKDLSRWLADEPVSAWREPWTLRAHRWLRRHRSWAAAAVLTSLLAGVIATLTSIRVDSERRRADRERDHARAEAARLAYDRAWAARDVGDYGAGLLWLGRSLQLIDPDNVQGRRSIRMTMGAWWPSVGRRLGGLDHEDDVWALGVSPDGKTLLSGDRLGHVRLWDMASGRPLPTLIRAGAQPPDTPGPRRMPMRAVFSPDGATIATAGFDGKARLWEADGGRLVLEISAGSPVHAIAFHPGGLALATGHDDAARLWRLPAGGRIGEARHERERVHAVAFPPDGRALLTGGGGGVIRAWDVADAHRLDPEIRTGSTILSLAVGPDGRTVAAGLGNGAVQVRSLDDGREVYPPLRHTSQVLAVAFSRDGARLLSGSFDTTAQLWDAATGRPIGEPLRHPGHVRSVAFSADGATAAMGAARQACLWSLPRPAAVARELSHRGILTDVAFQPGGRLLATGGRGGDVRLWDVATGRQVGAALDAGGVVRALAFSPRGPALAVGAEGGSARLWDTSTGRPIGPPMLHRGLTVECLDFRPDGRVLATGGHDGRVRFWDARTALPAGPELELPGGVLSLRYSPDGRRLVAGDDRGTVRLWETADGRPVREWKLSHVIRMVAFSPDGGLVAAASNDRTARLWDVRTGKERAQLPHQGEVFAVAFRPDGRVVVTCGFGGELRLWDVSSGRRIAETPHSVGPVLALAFSPDGHWIATAAFDGSARLWDSATGVPVGEPLAHGRPVWDVAFSPDGTHLSTACSDGSARLWPVPAPLTESNGALISRVVDWTQRTLTEGNMVESLAPLQPPAIPGR